MVMSTMDASTSFPFGVSIGLRPSSTGNSFSVLVQTEEFSAGSHGCVTTGRRSIRCDAPDGGTKPFRNQHFDRLAEHLLAAVAEHGFDLFVDQRDVAEGIDHQHAVRRGFHHLTELGLGLFARGDVAYDTGKLSGRRRRAFHSRPTQWEMTRRHCRSPSTSRPMPMTFFWPDCK
jgi:hypothetical protein